MNVPNPSRQLDHLELILSRGDLAKDARLTVLLPDGASIKPKGLKRVKVKLTAEQKKNATQLKLDLAMPGQLKRTTH